MTNLKYKIEFSIPRICSKLLKEELIKAGCELIGAAKKGLNFTTYDPSLIPNHAKIQVVTENWQERVNFSNRPMIEKYIKDESGRFIRNENGDRIPVQPPFYSFISGKQFKSFAV